MELEGSVLIVDEAHNLVDAVNSSHSAAITATQLQAASTQLAAYFERFQARLAPGGHALSKLCSWRLCKEQQHTMHHCCGCTH